jgi:polyisoprenoid-binding protein YceI
MKMPPPPTKNPADGPAGAYNIDLDHQAVIARVLHGGLSYSVLRFGVTKAVLNWDPANPAAMSLSATVDAKPHTDPIVYRIKPEQILNVAQFPEASFVSTAVRQTGPASADVEGNLTVMGITKPEVIHVQIVGVGKSVFGHPSMGFTGRMDVKLSDFITKGMLSGGAGESDICRLELEAEFNKA